MIVEQEFMVGDIVHFIPMGKKEFILKESGGALKIEEVDTFFTSNGKINSAHTHPLLILIRRPEEKKKWYQVFYKCHNEGVPKIASCLYNNEEDFYIRGISKDKLEWIELKFVCEK